MSFRLFVYYCALCGGVTAWFGWGLGRLIPVEQPIVLTGIKGFLLGILVGFGLGVVDALLNVRWTNVLWIAVRALVAASAGAFGGLMGGVIGQVLYTICERMKEGSLVCALLIVPGWVLTGFLIGIGVGIADLGERILRARGGPGGGPQANQQRARRHDLAGYWVASSTCAAWKLFSLVFRDEADTFWSPSAAGFVALGLCIGLLIGLAQVIRLKEAWDSRRVRFSRSGRQLILSERLVLKIGRAENCEIPLFGDATVEKLHARLVRRGGQYYVEDAGTTGGTYVNGQRINAPTPLRNGDAIGLGKCVLRFGERRQRPAATAAQ